ncbi:MAG: FTR1 family protein, partial [Lysobacterales bacterium]
MFGIGVLVFREVLEAALIISVVCAATRGIAGRGRFVGTGLLAGIAGAVLVALFAGRIADAASGLGQEIFNAGVLLAAVLMIGWHAIWMSSHGRKLALDSRAVGDAVRGGSRPLSALIVVVAIAVLREGSEVVLFLYGMAADGTSRAGLALGTLGGVVVGAALGFALYFGLLRIPLRHFFNATNWLLLLLAAGMASSAARFLIQADLL